MKAIGYIRQSKERKDRDSISPETQLEKIQQFAKLQDKKLVQTFQDIDISGFRVHYSKRTGLMDLIEYVKNNNIEKVYVYALSRLSRRIKDFIEITDILERHGVSVVSATEMVDMATPQGRLFRNILLSFNEYYSDSLSATIIDNHKKNVQLGKWNGGNVPYGFKWDKQNKKFIKSEQFKYFNQIKEKLILEKWSPGKIANYLNKKRIKGPTGGKWYGQTIKYIITNSFYRGYLQYDNETYRSDVVDVIITNEEWNVIQEVISKYENTSSKSQSSPHLLTGLLECSCGSRIGIKYNGSTNVRRYICASRQYEGKCKSNLLDADSLEDRLLNHIDRLVKSSYFDDIIEEYRNISKTDKKDHISEIRALEKELSNIVQAQEELYEETFLNKTIKKERFYEFNKKFDIQREELETAIKQLYKESESQEIDFIIDYKEAIKNFIVIFNKLNQDEKRIALQDLIDKIYVHDNYIEIKFPFSNEKIKSSSFKRGTMYF